MSQEGSGSRDDQHMEIDDLGTKLTLPPPSVKEGVPVVNRATRVYREEMGDEDAAGEDRDFPDKLRAPSSPDGATDLGGKSDEEILSLAGHLGKQATPGSRSSVRSRKSLFPTGPSTSKSDPDLSKVPTTPRLRDSSLTARGKASTSKHATTKDTRGATLAPPSQIASPTEHPLLKQIDVENDAGFEVSLGGNDLEKALPDALHLIKASASKAAAQGGPVPSFEEVPNTFPVTTAKSWVGSTAIMLATMDKMAKLFNLPEFKVVYDKAQTALVVQTPPPASQAVPSRTGRQPGAVFTFAKTTVDVATETEPGPTPSKVPRHASSGKNQSVQTSLSESNLHPVDSIAGESTQPPEDHSMEEGDESGPHRVASMLADEHTPAPSRRGSIHETEGDRVSRVPPLSIKLPEPCVVTSPFGQRVELDVLRLVSPDVLRAKLDKWNFLPIYLLAEDQVIKQLCCFMAIGNESFYGAVDTETLNKFIKLLQAAPSV